MKFVWNEFKRITLVTKEIVFKDQMVFWEKDMTQNIKQDKSLNHICTGITFHPEKHQIQSAILWYMQYSKPFLSGTLQLKHTWCVHVILKYSHTITCLAIGKYGIMCSAIVGGMNALEEPDISYFQPRCRAWCCEETGGGRDGISKRG